jgi:hypothetical protein
MGAGRCIVNHHHSLQLEVGGRGFARPYICLLIILMRPVCEQIALILASASSKAAAS